MDISVVWPFPQVFNTGLDTLLWLRDESLLEYRLYEIQDTMNFTLRCTVPDATYGKGEQQLECADFGRYKLLTNGKMMMERDPITGMYSSFVSKSSMPLMKTLCAFRGQIVGGNVRSNWPDCDPSTLVWSDIGSASFTPSRTNEAGFRRMPQGGEVLRTLELGDFVIAYGDKGINSLSPVTAPAATFKLEQMLNVGVVSKGAVAGDINQHVFIDRLGWLWSLSKKLELKRLGYKEFITQMTPEKIVITKFSEEQEYYISDGAVCYCLTPNGLSTVHQLITSIATVAGEPMAVFESNGDTRAVITLDTLDFGVRGKKTVQSVEAGMDSSGDARLTYLWKSDHRKDFLETPPSPFNREGVANKVLTADDFRIRIETDTYYDTSIDYVRMCWKMTDLRNVRVLPKESAV